MTSTTIALVVFACAFGFILALGGVWAAHQSSAGPVTDRRLQQLSGRERTQSKVAKAVKGNRRFSPADGGPISTRHTITNLIVQAGVQVSPVYFVLLSFGSAAGVAVLVFAMTSSWVWAITALIAIPPAPFCFVLYKRYSRAKKFESQLPQAMELMSRSLRAGHSFASSMRLVGDELADPIAVEFAAAYQEQELGIPLEACLDHLTQRVACKDLRFFALSVLIQKETGGDLAEVLDKSSYVIRERFRILGQVRALTAEGRMSGWVLVALPLLMLVVINAINPGYARLLFDHPTGHKLLMFAGVMQFLGMIAIKKVVSIKV